jgi:hypothetical protein
MAAPRRRPRWRKKPKTAPLFDWDEASLDDLRLIRHAIRAGWPPTRWPGIVKGILNTKTASRLLSAAQTCLLADKKNMAIEGKVGKVLGKIQRQALHGRLASSESRKHAMKCCRLISQNSNTEWTEWLMRLAKSAKKCVEAAAKAAEKDRLP